MLRSLGKGERPATRHDNTDFQVGDPLFELLLQSGSALGFTAVLCWLKGDWSEASHSLALPSVSSMHCPCPFDSLGQYAFHDSYASLSFPPRELSYDDACTRCEIMIRVRCEAERSQLLVVLVYAKALAGVKKGGRMVSAVTDIDGTRLERGDRLEPSINLLDVTFLESQRLPILLTFWRTHKDDRGRCLDTVTHRNPLFSEDIGTEPSRILAVDSLHTVYYGPVMKWCSS